MPKHFTRAGGALLSIAILAACGASGTTPATGGGSTSLTPQVVQQNNAAPYVPIQFPSGKVDFGDPTPTSAVRAADGFVYFAMAAGTGPQGSVLARVANNTRAAYFAESVNGIYSNLTADSLGNVWAIDGGNLTAWRDKQVVHSYPLNVNGPIAAGNDDNIYVLYASGGTAHLLRVTQSGTTTDTALPVTNAYVYSLTNGPDGNLWAVIGVNNTLDAYRISYTGTATNLGALPESSGQLTSAAGALWYLGQSNSNAHPTIYRLSTSGGLTHFEAPNGCSGYCSNSQLVYAGGALWFMNYDGLVSFSVGSSSFKTIQTNLADGGGLIGTQGSDGNLWAASLTLSAQQVPLAAVVLTHVLTASPASVTMFAGGAQTITVTETGSCSNLIAKSSNPSLFSVVRSSSSCNQATFTVTAQDQGSATITFSDNQTAYKSNRVTVQVVATSPV